MRVNVPQASISSPRRWVPLMGAARRWSIVNVSSHAAAHETSPYMPEGYLIYCVAKAALESVLHRASRPKCGRRVSPSTALGRAPSAPKARSRSSARLRLKGWQTPDALVAPIATLAALKDSDLTGRVLDVAGFGAPGPIRPRPNLRPWSCASTTPRGAKIVPFDPPHTVRMYVCGSPLRLDANSATPRSSSRTTS